MIDSTILMAYPLCVRRQRVPWVTGPEDVIKLLPAPWLGLGGDDFLGCFSPEVIDGFLEGRSSFLSFFLLGAPFPAALEVDKDAPSFPFFSSSFLYTTVDALTKAFCLVASISAKGWEVKHKDDKKEMERNKEG